MAHSHFPQEHSLAWWEGYSSQGPRSRNPYQGDPDKAAHSLDWLAGWHCRFFGEEP
jgi:hypothetical protein